MAKSFFGVKPLVGFSLFILALANTLFLTSCGHANKEPPLELLLCSPKTDNGILQQRLQDFLQINPGIPLKLTICASLEECREKFLLSFDSPRLRSEQAAQDKSKDSSPDVCMVSDRDIARLSENLRDLGPYIKEQGTTPKGWQAGNKEEEISKLFTFQGKTLAVPLGWSALTLYYNRRLFDRHGLPYPNASWEWGDFLHAAEMMTVRGDHNKILQYGVDVSPSPEVWLPFLWQNHGELIRQDGSWSLTDPQFIQSNLQALAFYADLARESHVAPSPAISSKVPLGSLFLDQKAAMTFAHRDLANRLTKLGMAWDIAPLPQKGEPATCLEAVGFGMSSRTKRPQEAWKLIAFLTTETSQETFIFNGFLAPASPSLLKSRVFIDFPGPKAVHNSVLIDSFDFARALPALPYWKEASDILSQEMAVLMSDPKMSARAILERMEARLDELRILNQYPMPSKEKKN